ncbi:MAG TPA: exopolysaccharide biosynthesis polyprenyl glycosylphosphotransferase [Candidatus Paceibacterota bacterium]|nr:exopolysaccharide biosynthesis polyprenyl glycosylphosphotransferase [Candidatus Paceibacterota bacterium]
MKNGARTLLLLFGDILLLGAAFAIMLYIYVSSHNGSFKNTALPHIFPFSILGLIWIVIFFVFNLYDREVSRLTIPHLRQIFTAFITALMVGIIFFYTIPFFQIAPKTNLLIFGGIAFIFFIAWRRIFYNIFSSHFRKKVVFIVGGRNNQPQVNDLVQYITAHPQSGFIVSGIYDLLKQFKESSRGDISRVFIVSKETWRDSENFKRLYDTKNEVLDLAYAYEDIMGRIPIEAIDEGWFMHNVRSHKKKIYDFEKRVLSIIIAALILVITSPFFAIIALLVKFNDGGPVLYSQTRVGKNGKNFRLYKFRSMKVDAEKNGPEWSTKEDLRITPVGRILRKLHIDELPQMFNIFKGDIDLVGPRPERPEFVLQLEKEIPFYHLRHIITPGFTGWAQIKFRYAGSVIDSKDKFEYDLYYLKNRNTFMDLGILLRTLQIIFTH